MHLKMRLLCATLVLGICSKKGRSLASLHALLAGLLPLHPIQVLGLLHWLPHGQTGLRADRFVSYTASCQDLVDILAAI